MLEITTYTIATLWYKLRCFGVTVDGSADIFCDNKSFVNKSIIPASVFNKTHNLICYHRARRSQVAGVIHIVCLPGQFNPSYLYTMPNMLGNTGKNLVD